MTASLRKGLVILPLALMLALATGCQLSRTQKNALIGGTGGALAGAESAPLLAAVSVPSPAACTTRCKCCAFSPSAFS